MNFSSVMLMVSVLGMLWLSCATCNSDSSDEGEGGQALASNIPFLSINLLHRLDIVPCTLPSPLQPNTGVQAMAFVYYNFHTSSHICFIHSETHVQHNFHSLLNRLNKAIEPQKIGNTYKAQAYERHFIQCPAGKRCRIKMSDMDLQERVKIAGDYICLDYLLIENPETNSKTELCGNESLNNYQFNTTLYITFRSGYTDQKGGFKIQIESLSASAMSDNKECLQQRDVLLQQEENKDMEPNRQYVPDGAKELLQRFDNLYSKRALAYSVDSYHYILRVAALSERSCDEETSAIAQGVLGLFSRELVGKARANVSNGYSY